MIKCHRQNNLLSKRHRSIRKVVAPAEVGRLLGLEKVVSSSLRRPISRRIKRGGVVAEAD
jgi:hypothetical protein